ncbi:cyanophycin synthetase [Siccirubricoccus deserti]|uniref:Cyanophycin synthetase n=2 Tax=Siccirubricoccus deserti TaxID=2013562 RepID=A0A9X0R515_9PROT|nr:cyanophycin synthetase [Siccirubricoccus deserti]
MRVIETGVYRGPHFYSHTPMVRIRLDLGALEAWPSDRLLGFNDALLAMLPGLGQHGCSFNEPGGLVRRLRDGTWLGHVAEHVAIELQCLAGSPVTRGKTRSVKGHEGVYDILYAYREEAVGLLAGRLALELVDSLLPLDMRGVQGLDRIAEDEQADLTEADSPFDMPAALDRLARLVRSTALGPTTRSLVEEAERRGIPVMRLDEHSLVQLGWGKHQQRLRASITGRTSHIAVENASDKDLTRALLTQAGVPVPKGSVVRDAEAAVREAERLGFPVVTKPLDGNHGRGVSTGLTTADEIRRGFAEAARHGRRVVVEQHVRGRDHRILVVGGEVVAVAERVPAHVVGDGRRSVAELIEEANRDPRRGEGHEKVMTRIVVDEQVLGLLARTGFSLDAVPHAGRVVQLRETANLSTGGTAIDRTDEIHPENAAIARRAALAVGLDVAGIDFLAPDIGQPVRETGGGIVEVNAAPGFRMHLEPSEGRPRDVARPVLDILFPRGETGRIPVLAVTGTNGKSTTVRMVAHILRRSGLRVGYTTTSGIYVDDALVSGGDASGPKSARTVLRDPTVEAAVLETARGGMLREGLGFNRCDVGTVLNVAADHLGLKGVDTLEDLARVKSIVAEAVHRDGHSVLNADDPLVAEMERHAGGRTVYFSLRGGADMPDFLRRHVGGGLLAVVRETNPHGGEIVVHDDRRRLPLMGAAEIPATLGGMAEFNVQNALAAVAMTYAQGVPLPVIRGALVGFTNSFEQNPGRLNVFDGHGFRVIVDYAHNPAGLSALCDLAWKLRSGYRRSIGMVSIPGDRREKDIREMGRIAAAGVFDELVFRERPDGRGRADGEVMRLLSEGAQEAGFPPERIHCIHDEAEAAIACLRMARPGDLVVLTPSSVEEIWQQVVGFDPTASPPVAEVAATAWG